MKLEFDSIDDLKHFLNWAETFHGKPTTVINVTGAGGGSGGVAGSLSAPLVGAEQWPKIDATGVAFDAPVSPESGEATPPAGDTKPADSPEPTKRKRRTKAEIEADEAAAVAAKAAQAAGGSVDVARVAHADGTVTTRSVGLQDVGAEGAETLNGDKKPEPADEAGESVVTPFQHLTRAREFIAKHGMPKYNESFTKAGLDANVMAYSAFQRALHLTALDELEKT